MSTDFGQHPPERCDVHVASLRGPRMQRHATRMRGGNGVVGGPAGRPSALTRGRSLLDDVACAQQQRFRDREPERFGGLEIDGESEVSGFLYREIGSLGSPRIL